MQCTSWQCSHKLFWPIVATYKLTNFIRCYSKTDSHSELETFIHKKRWSNSTFMVLVRWMTKQVQNRNKLHLRFKSWKNYYNNLMLILKIYFFTSFIIEPTTLKFLKVFFDQNIKDWTNEKSDRKRSKHPLKKRCYDILPNAKLPKISSGSQKQLWYLVMILGVCAFYSVAH
jgi:hypothetical protein